MTSTYYITEKELNETFLKSVKSLFKNKKITLTISESMDETEYLLSSEANKKSLKKSIKELEGGKGIEFSISNLKKFAKTNA